MDRRVALAPPEQRLKATGDAPVLTGHFDGYTAAHEAMMSLLPASCMNENSGTPIGGAPKILIDCVGTIVIFKPAGWEVDSTGGGEDRPLLSSFLQMQFSKELFPLPHLLDFGYGFLHRLDIPSSGLVLAGTTFEGLYSLRGQLNTYRLGREYHTLCHDLGVNMMEVDARIDASSIRVLRSTIDDLGRPAQTRFLSPAYLRVPTHSACCIIVVSIRTGRRHQIRAHTRYIGHPTVVDGWYSPAACVVTHDPLT